MNAREVARLLATCAAADRRTVGEADIIAWLQYVGDLDLADCERAVFEHYRDTNEWIMPADIRRRVKDMQIERLERTPLPPPPAELCDDPQAYIAALRGSAQQIASGVTRPAIEGSR